MSVTSDNFTINNIYIIIMGNATKNYLKTSDFKLNT